MRKMIHKKFLQIYNFMYDLFGNYNCPDYTLSRFVCKTFVLPSDISYDLFNIFTSVNGKIWSLDKFTIELSPSINMPSHTWFDKKEMKKYFENSLFTTVPNFSKFTKLKQLIINNTEITEIPNTLPECLLILNCYNNKIKQIHGLPKYLKEFHCKNNQLKILPESLPHLLEKINISNNQLTKFPETSLIFLKEFNCSGNELTKVPVIWGNFLQDLRINNNQLTEFPTTLPDLLTYLDCSNNQLTQFPTILPNSLTYLDCSNNQLTQFLIIPPNSLRTLDCSHNKLTKLPITLPNLLTTINCSFNQLTELPNTFFPSTIQDLNCSCNYLTNISYINNNCKQNYSHNYIKEISTHMLNILIGYNSIANIPIDLSYNPISNYICAYLKKKYTEKNDPNIRTYDPHEVFKRLSQLDYQIAMEV